MPRAPAMACDADSLGPPNSASRPPPPREAPSAWQSNRVWAVNAERLGRRREDAKTLGWVRKPRWCWSDKRSKAPAMELGRGVADGAGQRWRRKRAEQSAPRLPG